MYIELKWGNIIYFIIVDICEVMFYAILSMSFFLLNTKPDLYLDKALSRNHCSTKVDDGPR